MFAKQAAAKNAPRASAGGYGPPSKAAVVKAAPTSGPASARRVSVPSTAGAKAKALPKSAKGAGKGARLQEDDDDEEGGGVVTCANPGLLRQMLQGAVTDDHDDGPGGDDSDEERGFQLSTRIAPGTPQLGKQRRGLSSVPTLQSGGSSSPTISAPGVRAQGAPTVGAPTMRPAASQSVQDLTCFPRKTSQKVQPEALRPGSPAAIGAAVQAAAAAPIARMAPPPAKAIATGPPQRGCMAQQQAVRPGSRGVAISAVVASDVGGQRPVSRGGLACDVVGQRPVSRGGMVPSPSSAGGRPAPVNSTAAPRTGYANMHAAKAPGPAVYQPKAAQAVRRNPFDMLRGMGGQAPSSTAVPDSGSPTASGAAGSIGGGDSRADDEDDAFVMPADSDGSEDEGPARRVAQVVPMPGPSVAAPAPAVANQASQQKESAADYVERVKRGLVGSASATAVPGSPDSTAAPVPAMRARSSDARSSPTGGALRGQPVQAGQGVRARSSDPRQAVEAARQSPPWPGDSDDSDEDIVLPASAMRPSAGVAPGVPVGAWKADVKSMVKEFAQQERARNVANEGGQARKPPKAPAPNRHVAAPAPAAEEREVKDVKKGQELLYSRKPRDVDYTPATVEEYQQKYKDPVKLGSLGPDLDNPESLMRRAVQEKVKQFSKELHKVNKQRSNVNASQPKAEAKPDIKPADARAKALEFAKHSVPKPKVTPKPAPAVPKKVSPAPAPDEADEWDKIREMERRHNEEKIKVAQIKEYLAVNAAR